MAGVKPLSTASARSVPAILLSGIAAEVMAKNIKIDIEDSYKASLLEQCDNPQATAKIKSICDERVNLKDQTRFEHQIYGIELNKFASKGNYDRNIPVRTAFLQHVNKTGAKGRLRNLAESYAHEEQQRITPESETKNNAYSFFLSGAVCGGFLGSGLHLLPKTIDVGSLKWLNSSSRLKWLGPRLMQLNPALKFIARRRVSWWGAFAGMAVGALSLIPLHNRAINNWRSYQSKGGIDKDVQEKIKQAEAEIDTVTATRIDLESKYAN